ncbi:hypothetical protein SAMN02927900_03019 [Rhizobium mongolense subsp. loessense]|uniref:Uncharacterized protein n=1 Tax=Rhizobium mongolense subsp. loessense TaxID=158890 RepID=A0A1G4RUZ0_9HYPH|nr:hypothetical protein SAMN02927900_03019 [Rhizobium mongolense subsp. loessense]
MKAKLPRLLGKLGFKFRWRTIAEGRVQPLVDLFDKLGHSLGHVPKGS